MWQSHRNVHLVIVLYIFYHVRCEVPNLRVSWNKMEEIKNRTKRSNGGEIQKLARTSQQWTDYYECTSRVAGRLPGSQRLTAVSRIAYEGAVITLPCGLCLAPGERDRLTWLYSETLSNLSLAFLEDRDNILQSADGNLTIYHVTTEVSGVYRCQIGATVGELITLEVIDDEETYNVVRPPSSQGPYPSRPQVLDDIILSTSWSPWSDCSVCGRVGRRRKYGMCFVQVRNFKTLKKTITLHKNTSNEAILNSLKSFTAFPDGIPCRSQYLPSAIRELAAVRQRRNEIMIGLCKVPCKTNTIFDIDNGDGVVFESDINSKGYYLQNLPPQPPPPMRNIIFATRGERIIIKCPGTTLRDMPVSWRAGTRRVVPRLLHTSTDGRVHINVRDNIVFEQVEYTDTNMYSCWQDDSLCGTVKLVVWQGHAVFWSQRGVLLALICITFIIARVATRVLRKQKQRARM